MAGIGKLTGTVKHYDWGGTGFIPSLLQADNAAQKPWAEYWLGVHPLAECMVEQFNEKSLLRDIIAADKENTLGEYVNNQFGDLPYLLKVLDVKQMLSIQVHPSKTVAEKGFKKETGQGVSLTSPQRNYKDPNHKPELIVALGEFWLLHGFKQEAELEKILHDTKELNELVPVFRESSYEGLYKHVMEMSQARVNVILQPLLGRILPLYNANQLSKHQEDFWAARAALTFSTGNDIDRGIFSIYFFNLLRIEKGEGVFQAAGVPHAYLEGLNVEIMANSDNVLRGGLTSKHIDVQELLVNTRCEPTVPVILKGEKHGVENLYITPAPDFQLSSFVLKQGDKYSFIATTCEIILLIEGTVTVSDGTETVVLKPGSPAAVAFAGQTVTVEAKQNSLFFKATVAKQ